MNHFEINEFGQPIGFLLNKVQKPNFPEKKGIIGKFCMLEPISSEIHTDDLYKANSIDKNGECWTYLNYGPFDTISEYKKWITGIENLTDPTFYAIIDKNTSKAVGVISFLRIDTVNSSIEVGHLNFSNLLKKTKAATEALYLLLHYAFDLGFRRYEWKCNSLNFPSKIAAERFGFSYEGTFRQHLISKNRNRDTSWFSILDSEWTKIKTAYEIYLSDSNFDQNGNQKVSLSSLTEPLLKQKDPFKSIP
ncbi:acetyltransferase (GNAT) domain protein [Leptospira yanagawae serovar Saopaulo str. Sao Paulo = ATCC 700523]|uniref:Acetyltransferase (GNAT) domain protein n=1 Tax=Leptospira yanagawae serovar Saopaulo str. Sao Paulo = ATCC 700523 TaxID=1249483 RepID=A0A5E8HF88_9LEPT|nr:GNAT family protein [Leptospira yanagawae]EOQ90141.1 acetyltransferase (GNAT) domain protein [Leptospira yanagawae serovar Saopaulo str. Sao Paulo = ATCC 700523]